MQTYKSVSMAELTDFCRQDIFDFEDTSKLQVVDEMIGQDRAVAAIDFGLMCKSSEYNIFLAGAVGTGKTGYACRAARKLAKTEPIASDWCYVYNFKHPTKPLAISFAPGCGEVFAKDIKALYEQVNNRLKELFKSDEYEKTKTALLKELQIKQAKLWEDFSSWAEENNVMVQWESKDSLINMTPLYEGNVILGEDMQKLPKEVRENISQNLFTVQESAEEMIRKSQKLDLQFDTNMIELEEKFVCQLIDEYFLELKEKYKENELIVTYLADMTEAILKNLHYFKELHTITEEGPVSQEFLMEQKELRRNFKSQFGVNVFVDNSSLKGAPVIHEANPTYNNLIGKIEYKNTMGMFATNHTLIKAGAVQRANGGYLILNAQDLFKNGLAWEAIKRILKSGYIDIENINDQYTGVNIASLKPQHIPVKIKILLIGNHYIYNVLKERDEDFGKYFKILADFEDDMPNNKENAAKLANFIALKVKEKNLAHFTRDAVAKVLEHSCYVSGNQGKLTTYFNEILELIYQADVWRKIQGKQLVDKDCVIKAQEEKIKRINRYELSLQEMVAQGKILINLSGKAIGQINGLAVLETVDYMFGNVSKITANTYLGTDGVINIEREIKMSGSSHSKGVLILSSYLGNKYAQDFPLTVSASLTFEQLYSGIDGDSASSAELYALLSAIGQIPLKQYIAVTGSVNQKGEVQPIGGVSEKINGFFALCKQRGLTGEHGVIIPAQNVDELILSHDIIQAIQEGLFTIYPVYTIDEGIAILTDLQAGTADEKGQYPSGSVHALVLEKLGSNHKKMSELNNK